MKEWIKLKEQLLQNDHTREVRIINLQDDVTEFKSEIQNHVEQFCTDTISKKLVQYEKVAKSFQKFFNHEELSEILDNKADLELI